MLKIKKSVLGTLQTNSYIMYDETSKEAAIIDPACSGDVIMAQIRSMELSVKYIIITHAHADHIEALDFLKNATDAEVCIGEGDAKALNSMEGSLCYAFGITPPKTRADIHIKENDILHLGGHKLNFILTPGHTRGGICIYSDGHLISGDTLFFESIGRWDFPGGDFETLLNSIKNKLYTLPDETKVYPGHGDMTTIKHEKYNNPLVI